MSDDAGRPSRPLLTAYVDVDRLERNLTRFHALAAAHGPAVRAHVKAHRTVEIARRQLRAGARGIAVNQVAQARSYVAAGITDVVIAHPWRDPWRWRLIAELARDCRVAVHVDSLESVAGLSAAAASADSVVGIRVQLGTGDDITATPDDTLLDLARAAAAARSLSLDGITGYQALTTAESAPDREAVGRAAAEYAVRSAGLLRAHGIAFRTVAVGGTPTAEGAMAVEGVTEVCSGAYALQDAGMAAIGVCAPDDVAVSVTAEPGAGDAQLDAYPYPWQTPGERMPRPGSGPVHLLPPHVCALMPQIDHVTAREQKRPDSTWHVLNQMDEPDRAARPATRSPQAARTPRR
ncbi:MULTISPECIES: alanine racemase [unclassified Streptomyces]|uniref:alanine racemase n=1 Tax=unclassified Streptomyces TaxID=2593676 RepID=UPI002E7FC7AB|nr:alanine racemase [Streptomyces sp. NBC_00589]WTI34348.1 alanine racemase [Streptomyces sp. NBC_00775]WUB31980.1 alanine racemase [Streptomyces sp. NBC_00589]